MIVFGIGLAAGFAYLIPWLSKKGPAHGREQGVRTATDAASTVEANQPTMEVSHKTLTPDRPRLRIYFFGEKCVVRNEVLLPNTAQVWRSAKTRSLLAHLALRGSRGATATEIVDELWPLRDEFNGEAERRSLAAVRSYMSTLRHVLDPTGTRGSNRDIESTGERYRLRSDADVWVDVWEFEALASKAESLIARGQLQEGIDCWQRAVELVSPGGLLPDEMQLSAAFLEPIRQSLHVRWLAGLHRLA